MAFSNILEREASYSSDLVCPPGSPRQSTDGSNLPSRVDWQAFHHTASHCKSIISVQRLAAHRRTSSRLATESATACRLAAYPYIVADLQIVSSQATSKSTPLIKGKPALQQKVSTYSITTSPIKPPVSAPAQGTGHSPIPTPSSSSSYHLALSLVSFQPSLRDQPNNRPTTSETGMVDVDSPVHAFITALDSSPRGCVAARSAVW